MKDSNEYNGPFPVIDLAGTDFLVNALKMELIEQSDPENRISYFDMLDLQDHLELVYDTSTKSAYEGRWDQYFDKPNVILFWLRPMAAMDPAGMKELLDNTRPGWRSSFRTDLPVVNLAGTDFFADEQRNSFRQKDNPWNLIHFHEVQQINERHGVYLDTRTNNVPFPHELYLYDPPERLPEHVVFAEVPSGPQLAVILQEAKLNNGLQQDVASGPGRSRSPGR
jgi:hypothetical protein